MATDNVNEGSGSESPFESAKKAFSDTAATFTEQASAKARDYTAQGKDRAVEALDGVASLVGDAAGQVSEKLGEQYGGYIQQAADAVSNLAGTLRNKDADELIGDARNVVRSSPGIALAAAAAVGFLMVRVVKSGLTPKDSDDISAPTPTGKARAARKTTTRKRSTDAAPDTAPAASTFADVPIAGGPADNSPPVV